eukprot:5065448-Prymnesium_polylepis.1
MGAPEAASSAEMPRMREACKPRAAICVSMVASPDSESATLSSFEAVPSTSCCHLALHASACCWCASSG